MRLIAHSCHYVLCKPGFRVILFNGGPSSWSYKLSHNLLFNTQVPPWLPKGNGKILQEWTHQRQDHSMYRINPNHCRTSAAAAIPASGKHWLETSGTIPDILKKKPNHYHTPSSSHLRFQRKVLRTQTKTWEHGALHQQGGPGDFILVACSWAAWLVAPNIWVQME